MFVPEPNMGSNMGPNMRPNMGTKEKKRKLNWFVVETVPMQY